MRRRCGERNSRSSRWPTTWRGCGGRSRPAAGSSSSAVSTGTATPTTSSASSSAASAPISATSSRKARSATGWAISATSAIFWSSAASRAAISQVQTAPTHPRGEQATVAIPALNVAPTGRGHLIARAHTVHNMLLDWCPDLLGEFYQGFVLRRPEADAERMGRPALIGNVPNFCYENGWLNCDFQHGYMRRAAEHGDTTISPKQEA